MIGEHLGIVVRNRIKEIGVSQRALADQVGVSRQHLSAVLSGRHEASIALWEKVLVAVGGANPNWLDDLLVMEYSQRVADQPPRIREWLIEGFRDGYRTGLAILGV